MKTMARAGEAGDASRANEAQALVNLFRVLTEEQFDFWLGALNHAAAAMGGRAPKFTRDDRQKTISYWYLLMYLLEIYAASHNPFKVRRGQNSLSDGLVSMKQLGRDFKGRYEPETIRRYVFDLKQRGLIALDGRGPKAMVQLSAPAIVALTATIREWVVNFRDVDRRIQAMGVV
jgi:hypothetical protein